MLTGPTYSTGEPILVGDWVRVFVPLLMVWHHGIVRRISWIGNGFGVELANNTKSGGTTISDWYDFANGQTVILHRRASSPAHVQQIAARVDSKIGRPYHLLADNCEHFASYAHSGEAKSGSVQTLGVIAMGLVAMKLLASE